jgi:hypothetical protein
MFQDFLTQLAQQPAPGEAQEQAGVSSASTQGVPGTAVPTTASTARSSLPTTLPSEGVPGAVPLVTQAYAAVGVPALPSGYVPTSGLGPVWQGPVPLLGGFRSGPSPGTVPVPTTVTSTVRSGTTAPGTTGPGTTTNNPALQTFLMDALSQAPHMYASEGASSTAGTQPSLMATVPRPMAAPTRYAQQVGSNQVPTSMTSRAACQFRSFKPFRRLCLRWRLRTLQVESRGRPSLRTAACQSAFQVRLGTVPG